MLVDDLHLQIDYGIVVKAYQDIHDYGFIGDRVAFVQSREDFYRFDLIYRRM